MIYLVVEKDFKWVHRLFTTTIVGLDTVVVTAERTHPVSQSEIDELNWLLYDLGTLIVRNKLAQPLRSRV